MIQFICDVCGSEALARDLESKKAKPYGWLEREKVGGGVVELCSWKCAAVIRDQGSDRQYNDWKIENARDAARGMR